MINMHTANVDSSVPYTIKKEIFLHLPVVFTGSLTCSAKQLTYLFVQYVTHLLNGLATFSITQAPKTCSLSRIVVGNQA